MQPKQPNEALSFKIGLSGTFWKKIPEYSVLLDNKLIKKDQLTTSLNNGEQLTSPTEFIEFTAEVEEDVPHQLQIRLENKDNGDTIVEGQTIVKDMLLNVDSIEIEEISLGNLLWDESEFLPDDSQRPILKQCVNLGWNGTYTLTFTSPYYLWLLEKT